jgi:hypothetical protein
MKKMRCYAGLGFGYVLSKVILTGDSQIQQQIEEQYSSL